MLYGIDESYHPDCLNEVTWYNTVIYSKLHRKLFEAIIRHAKTDRYHLICYISAHDKKQYSYKEKDNSIGDIPIPNNTTIEALEALGDNLNFIDCWLKLFDRSYKVKCGIYNKAMKKMFQKMPTIKSKPLSQGEKL